MISSSSFKNFEKKKSMWDLPEFFGEAAADWRGERRSVESGLAAAVYYGMFFLATAGLTLMMFSGWCIKGGDSHLHSAVSNKNIFRFFFFCTGRDAACIKEPLTGNRCVIVEKVAADPKKSSERQRRQQTPLLAPGHQKQKKRGVGLLCNCSRYRNVAPVDRYS